MFRLTLESWYNVRVGESYWGGWESPWEAVQQHGAADALYRHHGSSAVPAAGAWCRGITETLHQNHKIPVPGRSSHNPKLILGKLLGTLTVFIDLLLVKPIKSVLTHFSYLWRQSKQKKTPFAGAPWESSCRREGAGLLGVLMPGMLRHTDFVGTFS